MPRLGGNQRRWQASCRRHGPVVLVSAKQSAELRDYLQQVHQERPARLATIDHGENIDVPTNEVILTVRSFVGNLVGTYSNFVELMTRARAR